MLSRSLEETLRRAMNLASSKKHEFATLEHLLFSLLEDKDAILSAFKRIARNIHDHHHHGHGHGEHGHGHHENDGVDLLDFFQQVGVRLTDGKDREGADDLGNGTVPKKRIYYF